MIDIEKTREALRDICQSSHCISDSLRIDLEPCELTALKNVVYDAIKELEHHQMSPKPPIIKKTFYYDDFWVDGDYETRKVTQEEVSCGACKQLLQWDGEIDKTHKFCQYCGERIDWGGLNNEQV